MFSESFRNAVQKAANKQADVPKDVHVFWASLQKNTSLIVFDKPDGVYQSYRALVKPGKTIVFFTPFSKKHELMSPYYEFHPCFIRDEKLKQCVVEKVGWDEMVYICENNAFPERITTIINAIK